MEHYDYSEEETYSLAMQMCSTSVFPMVLKSAIELDVFELIKKGGPHALVSSAELAAQLPTNNAETRVMLDRILRFLSSYSVLNCTLKSLPNGDGVERLYSLTPVCKYFTKNGDGASLAPWLIAAQDKVYMQTWYHLKDAILEGGFPFYKAYGMHNFDYHNIDTRFNDLFNQSMSNHSTIVIKKVLETYKGFEDLESLVDVGGGRGDSINMIVSKYPSIKAINFDLPHVIEHAPPYPGVEHIGGDMFVVVPKGDVIFMKFICHDWDDEHCLKLLMKCYEALPKNGKVILVECIMPEAPDNGLATKNIVTLDIMMLAYCPSGKERQKRNFVHWLKGQDSKNSRKYVVSSTTGSLNSINEFPKALYH